MIKPTAFSLASVRQVQQSPHDVRMILKIPISITYNKRSWNSSQEFQMNDYRSMTET